jgi:branched-chain amino acid transport system permease protein
MLGQNIYFYLIVSIILFVIAPFVDNYILYVCSLNFIFIIISLGYNLVMGFAGQISLCQGAFAALGAYISALLTIKLGINYWLALSIAACVTTAIGFAIGFPAIRLSGHYLALVTLGFNTIVEIVARVWSQMTGGSFGLIVPKPRLPFVDFTKDIHFFYFNLIIMLIFIALTINIINSKIGRSLKAIRDSEIGSISLGINIAKYKTMAFMLSGFYGAIGGGLYAITIGLITPDDFNLLRVLKMLTGIVVGGLGSILGTILGSVSITTLPEALRLFENFEELVYGIVLVLFLKFLPQGLVSLREKVEVKISKIRGKQHETA